MNISLDTEALRVSDEGAAMLQRVESLHPLLRANTGKALEDPQVPCPCWLATADAETPLFAT